MSLFNVDMMLYVLSYSKLEMLMMSIDSFYSLGSLMIAGIFIERRYSLARDRTNK